MKHLLGFFTGASGHLRTAILVVVIAFISLRFPHLTDWMGVELQAMFLRTASEITNWVFALVLLGMKQVNATGGTIDANVEIKRTIE